MNQKIMQNLNFGVYKFFNTKKSKKGTEDEII